MRVNGVSNITEKILGDARAWAQEHIDEAKTEITSTEKQYADQAAIDKRAILDEASVTVSSMQERARSQADMDRRKRILATKQQAVGEAFDEALKKLSALAEEARALLMVRMAVKYQTQDAELIFNAADQAKVGPLVVETVNAIYAKQQLKEVFSGSFIEQVKKLVLDQPVKHKATLSKTVGNFSGGFILKEGDIENNCTFEVLIGAVRDELEGDVSSILFG